MWNVAFFMPAERDVPLLAEATRHGDMRVLGVIAPDRAAPAAALAEVMGLAVWPDLAGAPFPRGTLLVELTDDGAPSLQEAAASRGWRRLGAADLRGLLQPVPRAPAPASSADVVPANPAVDPCVQAAFVRSLDRDLADLASGTRDLPAILAAWTSTLALRLEARHATLALLREDGSLLLAEGNAGGETRLEDGEAGASPWREVFASAQPLIAVEQGAADGLHLTALPLAALDAATSASAPRAALAVGHDGADTAAGFQAMTDVLAPVLGMRCELLRRRTEHTAMSLRFLEVAAAARELAAVADPDAALDATAAALRSCCGALAAERRPTGTDPVLAGIAPGQWLAFASPGRVPRLVLREDAHCWELTGKQRRHHWDAGHFTGDDAAAGGLLLAAAHTRKPATPPPAFPPAIASSPAVVTPAGERARPGSAAVPEPLLDLLAREMDRADRYHGAFSLSAFRATAALGPVLSGLAAQLRSSDRVFCEDPATLLVFAPDENHAVVQLERRVCAALPGLTGITGLNVIAGRALYPGRFTSPAELVAAALAGLDAAVHGD